MADIIDLTLTLHVLVVSTRLSYMYMMSAV